MPGDRSFALLRERTRGQRRSTGSHVPYKSLVELRATSMPDAAWAVSGIPQADPGGMTTPSFGIVYTRFDTSSAVRLRSPLSTSPAGIAPNVSCNARHHRFWRQL
jgi:hypothetical protein